MRYFKNIMLLALLVVFTGQLIAQESPSEIRDRSYDRKHYTEREVVPYPHLREADVFYEKRIWREIFFKEKMNMHFIYPNFDGDPKLPHPLIRPIFEAAKSGELTVYDPIGAHDFEIILPPEEVSQIGYREDTIWVTDPVTGEETQDVSVQELNLEDVKKVRLKEDWIFDKQHSTMVTRIITVTPIRERYDENGNYVGDVPMFHVFYPDLRHILVNYQAYNFYNDAARLSWNDVMEMRMFDSKIIQETNVYRRRIEDYKAGKDALYEAQRIKQEIFEFEHDLWSY